MTTKNSKLYKLFKTRNLNSRNLFKIQNSKLKIKGNIRASGLLVFVLLFSLVAATVYTLIGQDKRPAEASTWYSPEWSFRQKIVIDHNKVDADLTDFPLLINLDQDGNLANKAKSDATDILFTQSDGITKLSHQIENYKSDTGTLRAWVKTNLSSTADTELYIYYGNLSAADQQNITDVWSNNYAGVWLMNEGAGTTVHDYSGNDNHGTMTNMDPATDWIEHENGYALDFDGVDDYIDFGNDISLKTSLPASVSSWVKKSVNTVDGRAIISNDETGATAGSHRGIMFSFTFDNKISIQVGDNSGGCTPSSRKTKTGDSSLEIDLWYSTYGVIHNLNSMSVVVNGNEDNGLYSGTGDSLAYTSDSVQASRSMNASGCNINYFPGTIGDIRFSSTARSAEWISTEYVNQNAPSTFYSLSSEETNNPSWYSENWPQRKEISIDYTKVVGDQVSFPVFISLDSDTELSKFAKSDGTDIVFTDSNNYKLSHEISDYDPMNGSLGAWVKTPHLSSTSNTVIYMYYGNPFSADQQNIVDVWSNDFVGVWHMEETASPILDSTVNNNDGLQSGGVVFGADGKLDSSTSYAGDDDFIRVPVLNSSPTSYRTICSWINTAGANSVIVHQGRNSNDANSEYGFEINATGLLSFWDYDNGYGFNGTSATAVNDDSWNYVCFAKNQTSGSFYINGLLDNNITGLKNANISTNDFVIGEDYRDNNKRFIGNIDELRISGTFRSASWISTEYNNQNDPISFYALSEPVTNEDLPPLNPTNTVVYESSSMEVPIEDGVWNNNTAPHFTWSGALDNDGGSGVHGYNLYFGVDETADPALTSGIMSEGGTPFYSQETSYTLNRSMVDNETYYLRIKTFDAAGNNSSSETIFTYLFETQNPNPPEYINTSPAGCSTTNDFTFTWPDAVDLGSSGINYYQYKKGVVGEVVDHFGTELHETAYQDSDNVLYVRSVDNAGNFSTFITAVYCTVESPEIIDGPHVEARPSTLLVSWESSKDTTGYVEVYQGNTYLSQYGKNILAKDHMVEVLGLRPEQDYRYRIIWRDGEGNKGESVWYETTTSQTPQIINLNYDTISTTEALVSFTTNYQAEAIITYQGNNSTNSLPLLGTSTSFNLKLEGLEPGTDYLISAIAQTSDGTEFTGGITLATPPLPQISLLKYSFLPDTITTTAEFTWTTNIDTTSSIFYKKEGESQYRELSTSDKTQDHKIVVKDLQDSSSYTFYAGGIDEYGNTGRSPQQSFQTPLDSRAPIISNIIIETSNVGLSNIEEAQIVVSWQSDEPSTSQIEYTPGILSSDYSHRTVTDSNLTKSHIVVVSGLDENTPYNIRVVSADAASNTSYSQGQVVIPGEARKSILTIILNAFRGAFGWMGELL